MMIRPATTGCSNLVITRSVHRVRQESAIRHVRAHCTVRTPCYVTRYMWVWDQIVHSVWLVSAAIRIDCVHSLPCRYYIGYCIIYDNLDIYCSVAAWGWVQYCYLDCFASKTNMVYLFYCRFWKHFLSFHWQLKFNVFQ